MAGMVLTVEPGIDLLLDELCTSAATKAFAVPDAIDRFRGFGGVRLEDSVLVTRRRAQPTTCPRTADDVNVSPKRTSQLEKLL